MLDLETFGTAPGSVIPSIGAVEFDREKVLREFYLRICPQSCVAVGMTMDPSTIVWWLGQSEEARMELCKAPTHDIPNALIDFSDWAQCTGTEVIEVWGNGASFDNSLMAAAYRLCGLELPWKFYNDRCYRTVKALHPDLPLQKRSGTYHHALDDARTQAEHLITLPSFQRMCELEEA